VAEALEPRTFSLDELPDGDGLHACRRDQLAAWLVDYGLARPNGSLDTFELTAYGLEVARETDQLSFWIRADAFKI
jgi:hypothetical protein